MYSPSSTGQGESRSPGPLSSTTFSAVFASRNTFTIAHSPCKRSRATGFVSNLSGHVRGRFCGWLAGGCARADTADLSEMQTGVPPAPLLPCAATPPPPLPCPCYAAGPALRNLVGSPALLCSTMPVHIRRCSPLLCLCPALLPPRRSHAPLRPTGPGRLCICCSAPGSCPTAASSPP